MNGPETYEAFFITVSLIEGRPKGLGYVRMRRSTMVGAKTAAVVGASDLERMTDMARFAYLAGTHKIEPPAGSMTQLYELYEQWYERFETKLQH